MGQKNQKATPVQTREPIEIKVDLKRIWRLLDTEFKINQAKQALKYNDDQVAKQFLQIALNKIKVSLNFLRMANRVLFLEQEVKSTQANADNLVNVLIECCYTNSVIICEQSQQNINQIDRTLDDIMVQGKVMDPMMSKYEDNFQTNMTVDYMIQQLKKEEAQQLQELQPSNIQYKYIQV
ncbi:unnamed protein product [Paramecium pentaurelia]|uniref:Uncharacterized protein n=1 Tax=Paramecium pentaurelia TaxID=43138 RepID=A0A8S1S279_9CILI|nr:unnamed protein product [Paramecium pentaurelia]